ncbi:LysR family transcriptional regulator [Actinokineospora sp. NPDC004072]
MELEFRHLRALIAVADEGSITRAAAVLGLSQPALTAQIQRIERALGAPVFERGYSGVVPTGFGRTVLTRARTVVNEMAGLQGVVPPGSVATGGVELQLGCYPGALASAVVPPLVAAYEEPLRIHMHCDPSAADLLARVRTGRLDAAVVVEVIGFETGPQDGLLREVVVPVEPMFVALSENHPQASQDEVDLIELADENWIVDPQVDAGVTAALRWACGEAGFEPRITHEISDASAAREFIVSGQCVSMAQATSAEGRGLVVRPMRGDPIIRRIDLATRRPCPVEPASLRRIVAEAYLGLTGRNPSYARWWAENAVMTN